MKLVVGVLALVVYIRAYGINRVTKIMPVMEGEDTTGQRPEVRQICERMVENGEDFTLRSLPEMETMLLELRSLRDEMAEDTLEQQLREVCDAKQTAVEREATYDKRDLDDDQMTQMSPVEILEMMCEEVVEGTPLDEVCSQMAEAVDDDDEISDLLLTTCLRRIERQTQSPSMGRGDTNLAGNNGDGMGDMGIYGSLSEDLVEAIKDNIEGDTDDLALDTTCMAIVSNLPVTSVE